MEANMLLTKIGERRQVHIPKTIFEEMHLQPGEFMEVFRQSDDEIVLKKKKIVDMENNPLERGALPPVLPYEERMKILESMQQNATDDSEDIDLDFIKASRTSKKLTISFDE
jgi:AbrB family looped-hinge helix DNA binding protein